MKKKIVYILLTIALMITSYLLPVYAFDPWDIGGWPSLQSTYYRDTYASNTDLPASFLNDDGEIIQLDSAGSWARIIDVSVDNNSTFFPQQFYKADGKDVNESDRTRIQQKELRADYSIVQQWKISDAFSDRYLYFPVWAFRSSSDDVIKLDRKAELWKLAPKLYQVMQQFDDLFLLYSGIQKPDKIAYGEKHPSDYRYLCKVALGIQNEFSIHSGYGVSHDYQLGGTGWHDPENLENLKDYWESSYPWNKAGYTADTITAKEVDKLEFILDVVAPYFIKLFEERTIAYPEIESFSIGTSKGVIDKENNTITLKIPASVDIDALPDPVIVTPEGVKAVNYAGSIKNGRILYSVVPWDYCTGVTYDGVDSGDESGYGFGVDLSQNWLVIVESGNPYNLVTSFSVYVNGVERRGSIINADDNMSGKIILNLPVGTDLSSITPVVEHTGMYYTLASMEPGSMVDFSKTASEPVKLVVFNTEYNLRTEYDVVITAERSSENRIESYMIDGAAGVIEDNTIAISIPFATDLNTVHPEIRISEFASIKSAPENLKEGENIYIICAENGSELEYTVNITRTPAATESRIVSFKCGGYAAVIDHALGTITLDLPKGSASSFSPAIEISPFASISPSADTVFDFSRPVKYTVTAQNGSSSTYVVTVNIAGEAAENTYKKSLETIVNNIISRYRTGAKDDWEWMDLGLYENLPENMNSGHQYDFNISAMLADLDVTTNVAMTNIARKVMTLTARGFNCTKLSEYNDGNPYKDSKGNDVDDLVKTLYNYGGGYTINGPVFTLLALDMGNYTVPEDAKWTREKLLDTLLSHHYLSDGFGIDMVGAIMYTIAPYQDDTVYGERVRQKLNEGLACILESMSENFSFYAMGATNSESAAWIMMALCSMGIDWNVDPRFSDGQGHSALQHWVDNFANVGDGYFHHTSSVKNNALATYEGCYASMWYLGFLEHGGQGNPFYFYYHRFHFGATLSSDASIISFELEGKQGVIEEGEENSITVTLRKGTPLTNMKPDIVLADGAKLIAPGIPITFVEGVKQPFTVCAEDGKTFQTYFVTVVFDDISASGAELNIESICLQNSVLNEETILSNSVSVAEDGVTEILLTVKPGVDTSRMYLSADASYAAVCNPVLDGSQQMDLSDWLTVTITSEDGLTTNVYCIKVVAKAMAEITSFRVQAGGTWYSGEIDNSANTITVRNVDDSKLSSTALITDIDFTGRTCSPTSGVSIDFSSVVTYSLGGNAELASRSYQVSVLNQSGKIIAANGGSSDDPGSDSISGNVRILSLAILGKEAVIDHDLGTISVLLPMDTNVSAVTLEMTLSEGASSDPASGQVINLTTPLTITVRNKEEIKKYTVNVVFERSLSQKLWDALADASNVADHQVSYGRKLH